MPVKEIKRSKDKKTYRSSRRIKSKGEMPVKVIKRNKDTKTYRSSRRVKKRGKGGKFTWYGNNKENNYSVYNPYEETGDDYEYDDKIEEKYDDDDEYDETTFLKKQDDTEDLVPRSLLKRQLSESAVTMSQNGTLVPALSLTRLKSYDEEFDHLMPKPPTSLIGTPEAFWEEQADYGNLIERIKAVQLLPADGLRERSPFKDKKKEELEPSPKGLKRVFRELKRDLPRALDNDAFGSIFIRYDSESPHFMQAMLTGGPYSPYCHGLFLFDICCGKDYPAKNCLVLHTTKHSNTFKLHHSPGGFSPNLHSSSGKVCLSLLGTWSGIGWSPNKSNVYQVLSTLIRDVLGVEHPYYNEPNYGFWEGTAPTKGPHNDEVIKCDEIIREKTIELAMIAPLKSPPKGFEDAVRIHFLVRQSAIENSLNKWVEEATRRVVATKKLMIETERKYNEEKNKVDSSKKKHQKSKTALSALLKQYSRRKAHAERLNTLSVEVKAALLKNMGFSNAKLVINRKLDTMVYAQKSLGILRNKLGAMFNACISAKKVFCVERGGITFTAERKLTDTFRSKSNKDLDWETKHQDSSGLFEKALSKIHAVRDTIDTRKAVHTCVVDIVNQIIGSKLGEVPTISAKASRNSFAVLQHSESNDNQKNVCINLSTIKIEEEEDMKFGQAPSTSVD